ncbi:hypothetical protein AWM75_06085 [Aerococcus urinaehominis]|uniref:L,D-TPase catalytic domain-containing protein n=1 Tax=Aerococcus urinaehominis TaxID=128944 RepID=A0A0X8FMV0_9LACT|nr:L,D-transpeptidase family protein [Aerococcus urinaehominis]AMB99577.1 hypothetical protein AWM75_06085 [Aerococcus urinaehominis]SDL85995.1 L,D-transpeptidase catalytic domain [Aerococcus urinaehominis]
MKKKGITIFGIIIALLVVIYGGGVFFYQNHIMPNTQVSAVNISNLRPDQANKKISQELGQKEFTINENNQELAKIKVNDIAASIDASSLVNQQMDQQNVWTWPVEFFQTDDLTSQGATAIKIDEDKAYQVLTDLGIDNSQREPYQPKTLVNGENGLEKVAAVIGNTVHLDSFIHQLNTSLANHSDSLNLEDTYQPLDLEDEESKHVQAMLDQAAAIGQANIKMKIDGKEIQVPQDQIKQWLYVDEENNLNVDYEQATNYLYDINQEVAALLQPREFNGTIQGTVTVQPGTYGWYIDRDVATQELIDHILAAKDVTFEPTIAGEGYGQANYYGDSYIEIDLSNQKMWVYLNGEMALETDIVSGMAGTGVPTPTIPGSYAVWNKESPSVLVGVNQQLGNAYRQPVNYWLPFDFTGQGIHDANWQSNFGGSSYINAGSQGCINTPPSVMPTVFEMAYVGMPVVIYN